MSQNPPRVALVATIHDPENCLYSLTKAKLPELQALYGAVSVLCSAATHYATVELLQKSGATIRKETRRPS